MCRSQYKRIPKNRICYFLECSEFLLRAVRWYWDPDPLHLSKPIGKPELCPGQGRALPKYEHEVITYDDRIMSETRFEHMPGVRTGAEMLINPDLSSGTKIVWEKSKDRTLETFPNNFSPKISEVSKRNLKITSIVNKCVKNGHL